MIPAEVRSLCEELAIKMSRLSEFHFRLIFEDSELTLDYWPTTGRIGISNEKPTQPENLIEEIVRFWELSFSYVKPESKQGVSFYHKGVDLNDDSLMKFGKYKDKKLSSIPDHYLTWLFDQMDPRQRLEPLGKYIAYNFNLSTV